MYWDDHGRVGEILREHRCLRLPRDRRGLARKIRRLLRVVRRQQQGLSRTVAATQRRAEIGVESGGRVVAEICRVLAWADRELSGGSQD